jgi:hypothetical protein
MCVANLICRIVFRLFSVPLLVIAACFVNAQTVIADQKIVAPNMLPALFVDGNMTDNNFYSGGPRQILSDRIFSKLTAMPMPG